MTKWEYKTIKQEGRSGDFDENSITRNMNGMGKEGWEMVSAIGIAKWEGETKNILMIFKRPVD